MREDAAALIAGAGRPPPVARLRAACIGMGTDEEKVWDVAAHFSEWAVDHRANPDNVMGSPCGSSLDEFLRVRRRRRRGRRPIED